MSSQVEKVTHWVNVFCFLAFICVFNAIIRCKTIIFEWFIFCLCICVMYVSLRIKLVKMAFVRILLYIPCFKFDALCFVFYLVWGVFLFFFMYFCISTDTDLDFYIYITCAIVAMCFCGSIWDEIHSTVREM